MRYIKGLVVAALLLCGSGAADAQVSVGVHFNFGIQPVWGPVGYDYVENYYMPGIEVYYNVRRHRYYYNEGGRWIFSLNLPARYRGYDLYNGYKVVVNECNPWNNHHAYREKYSPYKDRHDQQPIRDSRDSKYYGNRNHPEHNNWLKQQRKDNGNHNGSYKGNDGARGNPGFKGNKAKEVNRGNDGNRGIDASRGNNGNGNGGRKDKQQSGNRGKGGGGRGK